MKKLKFVILLLGVLAATQIVARAGAPLTPALNFGSGASFAAPAGTFGWTFTLSTSLVVTDLGWFDFGGNGLAASHDVGLWSNDGTLLVSATVPSGTTGFLFSGFRYTPVTPLLLPPGSYTIAGFESGSSGDPITVDASGITTASGLSYDGSRSVSSASLTFPSANQFGNGNSYFGPNFIVTVPEPATTGLILLGGAGAFLIIARRQRR